MILNYEHQQSKTGTNKITLVFIHGLFGSLSNLGMLARAFENEHDILKIDLRNHGDSAHDPQMNYEVMAQDVLETLDHLKIDRFSVIGHSMGAKVAMRLTELSLDRLEQLVILDMSPFAYQQRHHDSILKALFAVEISKVTTRKDATDIMQNDIQEMGVIQFLLKSFHQGRWKFNVHALDHQYDNILAWKDIQPWNKPILVLRGANSPYVAKEVYIESIYRQFPLAQIETIDQAGHWLHAEQTQQVIKKIQDYLN